MEEYLIDQFFEDYYKLNKDDDKFYYRKYKKIDKNDYIGKFLYYINFTKKTSMIDLDVSKSLVEHYNKKYFNNKGTIVKQNKFKFELIIDNNEYRGDIIVNATYLLCKYIGIRASKRKLIEFKYKLRENEEEVNEILKLLYSTANFYPIPYNGKSLNQCKNICYDKFVRDSMFEFINRIKNNDILKEFGYINIYYKDATDFITQNKLKLFDKELSNINSLEEYIKLIKYILENRK